MQSTQEHKVIAPSQELAAVSSPAWSDAFGAASRAFQGRVDNFTAKYVGLWRTTPSDAPSPEPRFTPAEQAECERQLDSESQHLKSRLRQFPKRRKDRHCWRADLLEQARQMARGALKLDEGGLRLFFTEEGLEATRQFVCKARKFDPEMSDNSLHQALRNLWVMQSIQLLLQRPVALTQPAFAYSMLYPFNDNYLDDPERTAGSKGRFCEWLGQRLRGIKATAPDSHAGQVGQLIAQIEATFPRAELEDVWLSMSAIHNAQTDSLRQQSAELADDDLVELTVRKGGTSVLADAYLVGGQLSEAEAGFMFGYGALLQLMDDLQDFPDDLRGGHTTMFTRQAAAGCLDRLSSKFWHFGESALGFQMGFKPAMLERIRKLLRDNCKLLLLQTIARNQAHYTHGFSRRMERYSPLSFGYMAGRQTTLHQEYSEVMTQLQRRGRIGCAFDVLN